MKKMKRHFDVKIAVFFISITLLIATSCKQRDDYPDYSNYEQDKPAEDIIPPDDSLLPITEKIMNGTVFFKTFLLDSSQSIAQGFEYTHMRFINDLDQKVSMHLLEIDRTKANVSIRTLSPFDDYLYSTQTLPEMMSMNQETTSGHIVAAIVGGASSSGQPTGTYVKNGRVIKTNTSKTIPYVGLRKSTSEVEVLNTVNENLFPLEAFDPNEYSDVISGQNWMRYQDYDTVYTTTTTIARTAIGFSGDKQKIYCIAVDGVDTFSAGISLNNLGSVFKALGCTTAFYTNGSASSSLGVRLENNKDVKYALKNIPQSGQPGLISHAIGFVVR